MTSLYQRIEEIERSQLNTARERLGSTLMDGELLADFMLTRDGLIVDLSEELAQRIGYKVSELIGKPVLPLVAPESQKVVAESTQKTFSGPFKAFY